MTNRVASSAVLLFFMIGSTALSRPEKPVWPLTLREGLPGTLPGWTPAPKDDLPEEDENEIGKYVEISRFFQRIESPTSAKQFRVVIQDYNGKEVAGSIRRAVAEAKKNSSVETREVEIGGRKAFAVTDRSGLRPTTILTVLVTPSRLVLGQGANVTGEEAIALIRQVDLAKVASVTKEAGR
jgi:hypothetical protein